MADAPLKVLIVDDEAPARRRLRELLDDCTTAVSLRVIGEAASGREALSLLGSTPADLVLTDIHMPDMDGIELARHLLKLPAPPLLIFTTAYHEHAIAAFEVHAIDYLVKPVRVQRLLSALRQGAPAAPAVRHQARPFAVGRTPVSFRDRALARGAGADRGDRLSQGRAQVHHHPHRRPRVPARGIADTARGRVRGALRARASQLPGGARGDTRLRTPCQRRWRRALGSVAARCQRGTAGVAPAAVHRARDRA